MISDLYDKLPDEVVWNIIKYMRHPCAEILDEGLSTDNPYMRCCFCVKIIFLDTGNWIFIDTEDIICGDCDTEHENEWERLTEERYLQYLNEQRVDNYYFYDSDSDNEN